VLQEFQKHLNGIHENIKFTMKIEQNGALSFLNVLVTRRLDGTLGHTIHRKPTRAEILTPRQVLAPPSALVRRARKLCDAESLREEL